MGSRACPTCGAETDQYLVHVERSHPELWAVLERCKNHARLHARYGWS